MLSLQTCLIFASVHLYTLGGWEKRAYYVIAVLYCKKVGNSVRRDVILLLREGGEYKCGEPLDAGSQGQTGFHPCAPTVASFIQEQVESGSGGEQGTICLLSLLKGCLANFPTQVCMCACVHGCAWVHLVAYNNISSVSL